WFDVVGIAEHCTGVVQEDRTDLRDANLNGRRGLNHRSGQTIHGSIFGGTVASRTSESSPHSGGVLFRTNSCLALRVIGSHRVVGPVRALSPERLVVGGPAGGEVEQLRNGASVGPRTLMALDVLSELLRKGTQQAAHDQLLLRGEVTPAAVGDSLEPAR